MVGKFLVLLILPIVVLSHNDDSIPFCLCKAKDEKIVCVGGYSNGIDIKGKNISLVKVENGEILEEKIFDKNSKVVFESVPKDNFYILMRIGNGKSNIEILKDEILE